MALHVDACARCNLRMQCLTQTLHPEFVLFNDILPHFPGVVFLQVTRHSGRQQGYLSFDLHIRPVSLAHLKSSKAVMTRRVTMEPTPSKPKVVTTLRQRFEAESGEQSEDLASPTSSSEEAQPNKVTSRKRLYALRPHSFSFNGCMSQTPQKPQPQADGAQ